MDLSSEVVVESFIPNYNNFLINFTIMKNIDKKIEENHRIISPNLLLSDNKKDIEILLNIIAKKYKITIWDAAVALSKTLENL